MIIAINAHNIAKIRPVVDKINSGKAKENKANKALRIIKLIKEPNLLILALK